MMPIRILAGLAAAASLSACQQKADDPAFGQKVREYLMAHPEVIRDAVLKLNENEHQAEEKAAASAIQANRAALERDPRDFVANPNGKYTVVEFFDYRCGYCKLAAPDVLQLIQQNPDVRFVFKEFPIFGEVSDTAAKIALTPMAKAKAVQLYQVLMAEKALDDAALDRHLKELGIDPAAARKAAQAPEIAKQVADTHALAMTLKIQGTPAFFVGNTFISGADMGALRAAITVAKAQDLKRPG